ncbi:MAG: hypothetical protein J6B61_00350 [Romboutsia sp.]|nr:hypothetical protein [Romboutsia sp.]
MLDKEIELQNEQLEELELLKEQVANLIKEKNEIKKLNAIQSRIINKGANHDFFRRYIKEDEIISKIVEMLEYCGFKAHRATFKNFLKEEYRLDVDDMKDHELEAAAINLYRFQNATSRTIDKKLEELKALKLIDFDNNNYYIRGTDLLITIRNKEYKRINRTIKNESQLIIETEDKLFAYRFTLKNDYLTKNRELIDEFKIYNNIYAIDENIFVLGRRSSEDLPALIRRLSNMIKSDLVNTENLGESDEDGYEELLKQSDDNLFNLPSDKTLNTHLLITIYISKKIKVNLKDITQAFSRVANPIQIIRY